MAKPKPYRTEADLCAAFIGALDDGWVSYNETASWDLLLVRVADGFQIGVQAKLKLNALVLAQALDESRYAVAAPGPDCRAVLVPWDEVSAGLGFVCAYIGITIIRMAPPPEANGKMRRNFGRPKFDPCLPVIGKDWNAERYWFEQAPARRCELPDYVPDVRAGAPSPLQLTDWKIRALKIAVLLEIKGHVTRADFKHLALDHRRWVTRGAEWLKIEDGRYVAAPQLPDFKRQHPVVYEQIKADHDKWSRPPVEPGRLL